MAMLDASQLFFLSVIGIISLLVGNYWIGRHSLRALFSNPIEKKQAKTDITYRVRGVPQQWNSSQLQSFLKSDDSIPTVKSLAREINGRSSTATITYENSLPSSCLSTRGMRLPVSPETQSTRPELLTFDAHFHGITTLFTPPEEDHKVDIVAISGLGGHAFGSFKDRGREYMWLRDDLPHDLQCEDTERPMARIMIYGYDSAVASSQNTQNIEDLATGLHSSLLSLVSSPQAKPILFIAHGLGGLVVKQMLISLAKSEFERNKKIVQAVYGIVFFGVPHQGMDISSLLPIVGYGPNMFLVQSISHVNSQILSIQQRDFHTALGVKGESEVFCFYETVLSPTAKEDVNGKWTMTGSPALLVTKTSATHCREWENTPEHICAIARSHSEIVRFGPNDPEYDKVCERLKGLARRAVEGNRQRRAVNAKCLVPCRKNEEFVSRSEALDKLQQQLRNDQRRGGEDTHSTASLYGLGGVANPQIALACVY